MVQTQLEILGPLSKYEWITLVAPRRKSLDGGRTVRADGVPFSATPALAFIVIALITLCGQAGFYQFLTVVTLAIAL